MTNSELFSNAHKLARTNVKKCGGDYRIAFTWALSEVKSQEAKAALPVASKLKAFYKAFLCGDFPRAIGVALVSMLALAVLSIIPLVGGGLFVKLTFCCVLVVAFAAIFKVTKIDFDDSLVEYNDILSGLAA